MLAVCWVGTNLQFRYDDLTLMSSKPNTFREWFDKGWMILPPLPPGAKESGHNGPLPPAPLGFGYAVFHNDPTKSIVAVYTSAVADWPSRIRAAEWILLPPALLLLLGFAMAWIARGFRSSAPPEG